MIYIEHLVFLGSLIFIYTVKTLNENLLDQRRRILLKILL
jgi:hypothetical protein